NDAGDGDSGANNLQNFPVITSAAKSGSSTRITGTLDSTTNTTFRIDYYASDTCDLSGYGEGQRWIGYSVQPTDVHGHLSIDTGSGITGPAFVGNFVTATATDPSGNTSEFSQCVIVTTATAQADLGVL